MAAYNAEATIVESIGSVISQTFFDWELIVVDDCSLDGTVGIVRALAEVDSRIRLYRHPVNKGVAAARNLGLGEAVGEWIAFLDSDDVWLEEKLERQLGFAKEYGAVITYTATAYMDSTGRMFDYVLPAVFRLTYRELLRRNIMSCSSVMVQRDVMVNFPICADTHEDYVAWMRIVRGVGYAAGLNKPLLLYRMGEETKSSGRIRSALMTFRVYRLVGYGGVLSGLYTLRYSIHSITKRILIRLGRTSVNAGNEAD